MNVLFRVDATPGLGLGHLMRCVTLAERLQEAAHDVDFVGRYSDEAAALMVRRGHRVTALPESAVIPARLPSPEWRHPAQQDEADETLHALRDRGSFDWLVVDSYALDAAWERRMRSIAERVMVIDDLANRAHDCDLLLDQNFFLEPRTRYEGLVPGACRTLLGPRYALLRQEFGAARGTLATRSGNVHRVLVSFGGHDAIGLTRKALAAIHRAGLSALEIDVVTTAANPDFPAIEHQCSTHESWRLHASPDIASLMTQADLAIGAGGIMNWERACLRLPCIVVAVADNQVPIAHDLAQDGRCVYLGRAPDVSELQLRDVLRGLMAAPALVRALSERVGALVDGNGAERVAERLTSGAIELRSAKRSDTRNIYDWRNTAETRRHAFNPSPINFERHAQWFEDVLANPKVALLVGERNCTALGVLRYDLDGATAGISVYLVPGHAGRGLGSSLIEAGTRWLRARHPKIRRIVAEISPDNAASLGAFANAGFVGHAHTFIRKLDDEAT